MPRQGPGPRMCPGHDVGPHLQEPMLHDLGHTLQPLTQSICCLEARLRLFLPVACISPPFTADGAARFSKPFPWCINNSITLSAFAQVREGVLCPMSDEYPGRSVLARSGSACSCRQYDSSTTRSYHEVVFHRRGRGGSVPEERQEPSVPYPDQAWGRRTRLLLCAARMPGVYRSSTEQDETRTREKQGSGAVRC